MEDHRLEKKLLQLEEQFWQALKERDGGAAARLMDRGCLTVGAQGVASVEPEALRDMVPRAAYTLERFEVVSPQVRLLSDDVAVVTYQVNEDLTVDGAPVHLTANDASTWVRRDGRWLCALHTESLAGDPFGRDRRSPAPAPDDGPPARDGEEDGGGERSRWPGSH